MMRTEVVLLQVKENILTPLYSETENANNLVHKVCQQKA